MNMKLKILGSSSKGNAYILQSPTGSLLIEAGIPWREMQKGLNYDLSNVVGCLVSHEHKDHSKAVTDVMKAGIEVYMSGGTMDLWPVHNHRMNLVRKGKQFSIADFNVMPFDTEHDANEPLGFLIQYKPTKEKLLFITDSYYCKYKFRDINYLLIECNYIKETLDQNIEDGYVPMEHRPRLLRSHFSLENVKKFLKANDLSRCQEIVLLHLSSRNSDAKRMVKEIEEVAGIKPKVATKGLGVELNRYPY